MQVEPCTVIGSSSRVLFDRYLEILGHMALKMSLTVKNITRSLFDGHLMADGRRIKDEWRGQQYSRDYQQGLVLLCFLTRIYAKSNTTA